MQGVPAVGATEGAGESPGSSMPLARTANPSPPGQTFVMMQVVPSGGAIEGAGEPPGASIPLAMTAQSSISSLPPGQTVAMMQLVPVLMPSMPMADQAHARQMEAKVLESAMPDVYED